MAGAAQDAITAARFSITIDGYEIASFSELQGITTSVDVVDYLSSTDKEVVFKKLPGKQAPPTVTLKRGKTNDMSLWSWHETVRMGDMGAARKSCSLVMYNVDGKPVARYHMMHAWPAKIEIGALKAGASEVLMETVTIVCEHIERVAP
jgi:phage tail-like protein